jgi:hypothetical protein
MKQTAVEWLLKNLINEPFSEEDFKHNFNVWNKAEEMEKQQIIDAWENIGAENSEQYYNETFKKENNENKN